MGVSGNYASGSQDSCWEISTRSVFLKVRLSLDWQYLHLQTGTCLIISPVTSPSVPIYFFVERRLQATQSAKLLRAFLKIRRWHEIRYNDLPASNICWDAAQGRLTFDDVHRIFTLLRNRGRIVFSLWFHSTLSKRKQHTTQLLRQLDATFKSVYDNRLRTFLVSIHSLRSGADLENIDIVFTIQVSLTIDICHYLYLLDGGLLRKEMEDACVLKNVWKLSWTVYIWTEGSWLRTFW